MGLRVHSGLTTPVTVLMLAFHATSTAAAGHVMPQTNASGPTCEILVQDTGSALVLQAILRSKTDLTGDYGLTVLKQNANGTSQNMQSGQFSSEQTSGLVLTTLILERAAIGHYRATLAIHSNRGSVSCNSP